MRSHSTLNTPGPKRAHSQRFFTERPPWLRKVPGATRLQARSMVLVVVLFAGLSYAPPVRGSLIEERAFSPHRLVGVDGAVRHDSPLFVGPRVGFVVDSGFGRSVRKRRGDHQSLAGRLRAAPSLRLVERAATLLAVPSGTLAEPDLHSVLEILLDSTGTRELVLRALSHSTLPEFDASLAALIEIVPDSTRQFDFVLSAAGTSGGPLSFRALQERVSADNRDTARAARNREARLWGAMFKIDRLQTCSQMLLQYAFPNEGAHPQLNAVLARQLTLGLDAARADADAEVELAPAVLQFVAAGQTTMPFRAGSPGSPRRHVLGTLESMLIARSGPVELSALLVFSALDAPDLARRAATADYRVIEREPWLLPVDRDSTGSHLVWPDWLAPAASRSQAGSVITRVFNNFRIDRISSLPTADADVQAAFARWNLTMVPGDAAAGTAVKSARNDVSLLSRSIVDEIRSTYAFSSTTGATFDSAVADGLVLDRAQRTWPADVRTRSLIPPFLSATNDVAGTGTSQQSPANHVGVPLAQYLVRRELERRALVLYSVVAAQHWNWTPRQALQLDLARIDNTFDSIARVAPGLVRTQVVHSIIRGTSIPPVSTWQAPPGCTRPVATVLQRRLSFDDALYDETIRLECPGIAARILRWVGPIPAWLLTPLRRHSRLFDFAQVSLAAKELHLQGERRRLPRLDDIDLVRARPDLAIPSLLAYASVPILPWRYVHEHLAFQVAHRDLGDFLSVAMAQDRKSEANESNLPVQLSAAFAEAPLDVAADSASFVGVRTALTKPVSDLLNALVDHRFRTDLQPIVDKMSDAPPTTTTVDGRGNPSGVQCNPTAHNPARQAAEKAVADSIARDAAIETRLGAWNLDPLRTMAPDSIEVLRTVFDHTLTHYVAAYRLVFAQPVGIRLAVLNGSVNVPDPIQRALIADPRLFSAYGLDVGGTTDSAEQRLIAATLRVLRQPERGAAAADWLRSSGLYPYAMNERAGGMSILLPVAERAPLISTVDGRAQVAMLTTIDHIAALARGDSLPRPGRPAASFLDTLRTQWASTLDGGYGSAASTAAKYQQQVAQSQQANDVFGISLTGTDFGVGPLTPGIFFGSGGTSFQFNFSQAGGIAISGAFLGIPAPSTLSVFAPSAIDANQVTGPATLSDGEGSTASAPLVDGLSVLPARVAEAGVITVSPDRSPAGAELPNGVVSDDYIPTTGREFVLSWTFVPSTGGAVASPFAETLSRFWVAGLVGRAYDHLTVPERSQVMAEMGRGGFTNQTLDLLVRRGNEAIEEDRISNREWFRTSYVDQLVPERREAHPCPVSGCVSNEQEASKYVSDFNTSSSTAFENHIKESQRLWHRDGVFSDGYPAITITYGNDYRYLQFDYHFQLIDGTEARLQYLEPTPFWLVAPVRKDPAGHVLEKLTALAAEEGSLGTVDGVSRAFVRITSPTVHELLEQAHDAQIEKIFDPVKDMLADQARKTLKDLTVWAQNNDGDVGVVTPFVPPPLACGLVAILPSPLEIASRKYETIDEWLDRELRSPISEQVYKGGVFITAPNPLP
jgi:hypothetical protein